MSTAANTVRCKTCLGSGEVTLEDGISKAKIAAKDGQRPAWVGLLSRTRFKPCPDCSKPVEVPAEPKAKVKSKSAARRRWSR